MDNGWYALSREGVGIIQRAYGRKRPWWKRSVFTRAERKRLDEIIGEMKQWKMKSSSRA